MRRRPKFAGRHKFICAVDGMAYYSEDMIIRWDGAKVYKKNWHPRHPQELRKTIREDVSVDNPRPEKGYGSTDGEGYIFIDRDNEPEL